MNVAKVEVRLPRSTQFLGCHTRVYDIFGRWLADGEFRGIYTWQDAHSRLRPVYPGAEIIIVDVLSPLLGGSPKVNGGGQ